MTGAMLGFPGEDYTTPQTIQKTGGFGDPATAARAARAASSGRWTARRELGLTDLMLHAGFLPEVGDPDRKPFLDTLGKVSQLAAEKGVTVAFETGQETADLLRRTLDDLKCPNLKVNFDPANMLLYDKGDPIRAVESSARTSAASTSRTRTGRRRRARGARRCRSARGRRTSGSSCGRSRRSATRGRCASSARSATSKQRFDDIAHGVRFIREVLG